MYFFGTFSLAILGIIGIIKLLIMNSEIRRAGKLIFMDKDKDNKEINYFLIAYSIVYFVLNIILLFSGSLFASILFFCMFIFFVSSIIINKKYKNISGIYENGLIDKNKDYYKWKDIHSYGIFENTIFGYLKKGEYFEIKNIDDIVNIEKLISNNNVKKRETK